YEAPSDTDCRMAAHIYRELVDALRDVAIECHGTDQLRARLSNTLSSYLSLAEGYNLRQRRMVKLITRLSQSLANAEPTNPLPNDAMNYLKSCGVVSEDAVRFVEFMSQRMSA
ncbi:hypothetical protein NXZ52_28460, partial [Escherichia coli]|nr:hypothetical protein [Escherichia coli]